MLPELAQQGVDTDDLLRRYRQQNSPLSGAHAASQSALAGIEADGRRAVAGGLFSKEAGATGRNALASLRMEPRNFLSNAMSGVAQAVDAPMAAARGLYRKATWR